MKRATMLSPPPDIDEYWVCSGYAKSTHRQCKLEAIYEIDGKKFCFQHAARFALRLMLIEDVPNEQR